MCANVYFTYVYACVIFVCVSRVYECVFLCLCVSVSTSGYFEHVCTRRRLCILHVYFGYVCEYVFWVCVRVCISGIHCRIQLVCEGINCSIDVIDCMYHQLCMSDVTTLRGGYVTSDAASQRHERRICDWHGLYRDISVIDHSPITFRIWESFFPPLSKLS